VLGVLGKIALKPEALGKVQSVEAFVSNPNKIPNQQPPQKLISKTNEPQASQEKSDGVARQLTLDSIRRFLKQNSASSQQKRYCRECGREMQYLDAHFWLEGTDVASVVPLPFCPSCEPDVLTSLRRKREPGRLAS
jgi:hypothetical protein